MLCSKGEGWIERALVFSDRYPAKIHSIHEIWRITYGIDNPVLVPVAESPWLNSLDSERRSITISQTAGIGGCRSDRL